MLYDKKIKLAIVDDHNLFRKGIIKLITLADKGNKYEILFEAESGEDLKSKINIVELPDIILMDIDMPDMNGYEAVEWLNKCYPDIPVLIISMFEKEEGVLRMLRLGIKGYLSKDIEVEDINRALETVVNRGYFYSGFVSDIITKQLNDKNSNTGNTPKIDKTTFTETELTLIKLACTELTYLQIADKMNISPKTVDGYRDNLFRKLGVKSRVGLAMYAVQHGIVNK